MRRCRAAPDFGPWCEPASSMWWCDDALDDVMLLAQHGIRGLALWLRYPDPQAVLALASRCPWRRAWLDDLGAPDPLTVDWIDDEYAATRGAPF